jgi:ribulose-phosphate 3-epimerase
MIEIAPSILSADFSRLGEQIDEALSAGVPRIHCDIMDGQFVPNISFGPAIVASFSDRLHKARVLVEVHLMIMQPERYLRDFVRAGGNIILVHVETCPHLHRTLQMIHELGASTGVVLNPATPLDALVEVLPDVDQILLMTVNPGFGGQDFIPQSLDKIRRLRGMLHERGMNSIPIEIDGGVHPGTIGPAYDAGARIAVAGSAVFNRNRSVSENIEALRSSCQPVV